MSSRTFKDTAGQAWTVVVNVAALKRVKDATDVMLTDLVSAEHRPELLRRLSDDVFYLFELLQAVVAPQIAERKLTAEQFAERLDEEAVEAAMQALLEAIIDYFPPDRRDPLQQMLATVNQAWAEKRQAAKTSVLQAIESPRFRALVDQEIEREIDEAARRAREASTPGSGPGSSPDSSASIPAP